MSTWPSGFTSGCSFIRSETTIPFGQHSSVFHKKSGPLSQHLLSIKDLAVKPLEMSSAGLDLESTDYYCSREEPSWITERQFTMKVYDVLVASTTLAKEPASVKKSLGMATATKLISCSFRKPCIRCTMERAFSCCSTNIWIHILPGEAWSPKTTNPNANSRNCRRTGWNGFVATCNG